MGMGYWATILSLLALDLAAIFGTALVLLGISVSAGGAQLSALENSLPAVSLVACALFPISYGMAGLYRVIDMHPAAELHRMFVVSLIIGTAATVTAALLDPSQAYALALFSVLVAIVLPSSRVLGRILLARTDWWGVPAVVLGDGKHGEAVIRTLSRWPELGFRPVALLNEEEIPVNGSAMRSAGSDRALNIAQEHRVPYAIIAMPTLPYKDRARLITKMGRFYQRLFVVPEGMGPAALWTARSSSQGLLGYGLKHFKLSVAARAVKRSIDIVGAAVGLVVLAPLFSAIAALISIDSTGPVLFRQKRMGLDGRCFTVLKFRTMYIDAEAKLHEILKEDPERKAQYDRYHKLDDDPRVTRVGKWLRRLSLDELPQLWNVLRGDMSLVGPRAYMPGELPMMNGLSRTVLQCPPGLTGLWQVSGRNNLDFSTRVDLDVHYMQNWTLWLDLYILIRTIPVVMTGDGVK
jgi:Undecaprenyl-phosphate galactose phosphotransferase WbaP